ncbi:MAG: energy transducer TonB [Muribaculaceae bacterium]|nr:energy transducer TonB [Muribaculaceae bacterium]
MKVKAILFLFGAFLTYYIDFGASAQTCRVTSGVGADGKMTYKEVFEFDFVEEKPDFPGGRASMVAYINEHRRYPAEAYARGVEGRVTCSFVINTDGSVSNISVIRGVEPSLNREAVRLLSKMPAWKPGKISGQPVPVRVICYVPFRK